MIFTKKEVMHYPRCSSSQKVKNGFIRGLQKYKSKQYFCFELDKELGRKSKTIAS